jgi:hypothetical protein
MQLDRIEKVTLELNKWVVDIPGKRIKVTQTVQTFAMRENDIRVDYGII